MKNNFFLLSELLSEREKDSAAVKDSFSNVPEDFELTGKFYAMKAEDSAAAAKFSAKAIDLYAVFAEDYPKTAEDYAATKELSAFILQHSFRKIEDTCITITIHSNQIKN